MRAYEAIADVPSLLHCSSLLSLAIKIASVSTGMGAIQSDNSVCITQVLVILD
jgi:hypothetical protein